MTLKYDLFDIFAAAIMNDERVVIIEGKDDYAIYKAIATKSNPKIEVYQVNEFENYEAGCRGVIACLEFLQAKLTENPNHANKILGVIDRDARFYRNEIPNLLGLFVTKYYSIETYFATTNNLRKLLSKITYSPISDINETVTDFVQTDFQNSLETLYLLSLEALKNACTQGYNTSICYDDSPAKIAGKDFINRVLPQINAKRSELETLENEHNLTINNIKQIAKGKWYLFWFLAQIYPKIKTLKENCKQNNIPQCRSCKVGNFADCLYKTKQNTYRIENLQDDILQFIDKTECIDIIDTFQNLN